MHPDTFSRLFKLYTERRLGEYVNGLRVREATHLLSATGDTVLDIALAVGFGSLQGLQARNEDHRGGLAVGPRSLRETIMSESKITVEQKGHILLIGINRPEKRNAFDIEMFVDVARAYGRLHHDPELWCGLLFAQGDHFTSGLELDKWAEPFSAGKFPGLPEGCIDPVGLDEDKRLGKPMVMAAQGYCYTIGMEMMLATDVRVVASNTRLAQLEVKRGIYPVGGGTVRLLQEVGWSNAMRYLLTGDEITADEALRMGMVQEVVEPGKQFQRALELAERIAKQAPLAVQTCLKSARIARVDGDRASLARLLPDIMPLMKSEDVKEGVMSFIERREARFTGR